MPSASARVASSAWRRRIVGRWRRRSIPSRSWTLHVHHVVSLAKGGDNSSENLVTLCHICHRNVGTDHSLVRKVNRRRRRYVLFISMEKGVSGYILRFGDEPALPMRTATELEQNLSSVVIQGEDFEHLLKVTWLRVQVYVVEPTTSILNEDLDLHGMAAAHQFTLSSPRCRAKQP